MGYDICRVAYLRGLVHRSLFFPSRAFVLATGVGSYVCIVLRGIHTATETDFAIIEIPVNAAIYAVALFGLMHILVLKKAPKTLQTDRRIQPSGRRRCRKLTTTQIFLPCVLPSCFGGLHVK